jgi:uncharacterized small protein (DUF1192 family)
MSIENRHQLDNTRTKLQELEHLYAKTRQGPATSEHVRELTLRSLKKRINQFKEEIARFEARVSAAALSDFNAPGVTPAEPGAAPGGGGR